MRQILYSIIFLILSCSTPSRNGNEEFSKVVDNLLRYRFSEADMIIIETSKLTIQDTNDIYYNHNDIGIGMMKRLVDMKIISQDDAKYMFEHIDTSLSLSIDTTGFFVKAINLDSLRSIFQSNSLDDSYTYLRNALGTQGYYSFSTPLYSEDKNILLMFVAYHCGSLCGQGYFLVLKKVNNGWKIIKETGTWES